MKRDIQLSVEIPRNLFHKPEVDFIGKALYMEPRIDEVQYRYDGYWKNGMKHGHGYELKQGEDGALWEEYMGEWRDDFKSGKGKMVSASGTVYKGMWQNDKMHGKGKLFEDETWYVGDFQNGMMSGYGCIKQDNSFEYHGFVEMNQMHGLGKMKYWPVDENGLPDSVYEGQWWRDKPEGQGYMTYNYGENALKGQFKDGHVHGLGLHTTRLSNGQKIKYEGSFEWGKYHGHGTMTYYDDNDDVTAEVTCRWFQGVKQNGFGQFKSEGEYAYEGTMKATYKDMMVCLQSDGMGKMEYWPVMKKNDKDVHMESYEGMWSNGEYNGQGVHKWNYGQDEYAGEFMNGMRHGTGKHASKLPDGGESVYSGTYVYDKREGQGTLSITDSEGNMIKQTTCDWFEGNMTSMARVPYSKHFIRVDHGTDVDRSNVKVWKPKKQRDRKRAKTEKTVTDTHDKVQGRL